MPLATEKSNTTSPIIETKRLRLRMFRADDLDNLAALLADPDVMRYVEDGQPKDRDVAEKALHRALGTAWLWTLGR